MPNTSQTRACPYCKEEIRVDAVKCKHCGSMLADRPSHGGTCPFCKETIHAEAIRCKHCRANLVPDKPSNAGCGCNHVGLRPGQPVTTMRRVGVLDPPRPGGECWEFCTLICF